MRDQNLKLLKELELSELGKELGFQYQGTAEIVNEGTIVIWMRETHYEAYGQFELVFFCDEAVLEARIIDLDEEDDLGTAAVIIFNFGKYWHSDKKVQKRLKKWKRFVKLCKALEVE